MKLPRKLLTPVLALASMFGSVAIAQEKPALPDTPAVNLKLPSLSETHWNYQDPHSAFDYKVVKPVSASQSPLGDGFIGRLAGYVDRHSNESQAPFDFAMEYKVRSRFTLVAGTLADPRTHSGLYEANREALRVTTGLPDWETRNLRDMMSGGVPGQRAPRGGDGFGFGIKIQLGGNR